MDASRDGIQKLMTAEKEAQAIVSAAREEKTARLRQAVEEAKGEIAAYRAMREETYSKMLREQTGSKVEAESQLKVEFDAEMAKLKSQIDSSKGKIIGDLVASVTRA
uniref:V-type proton ATPase subunit G n=1 Tax=Ostreococcus mediterraneus TaxID=1486918 RepID=A0A6T5YIX6_9CHLO|mmetsp:Transcript_4858/g.17629  ORF Transcript_4858/g.17629 Transcript_4858/m.17629 type:complete len:107 (-) Transcript_4858:84-404(-)